MIYPRVDDLLQNVDSRYALVIIARQARPADQQLPPPARRGHLRRQSAAARRVALEELPDDGPRGGLPGHAQVRLPRRAPASPLYRRPTGITSAWLRVLLGVTGGIAAYKACEVCRLLVARGHDVVPLLTPDAERFVTAETFRALARRPPGGRRLSRTSTRARPARRRAVHREHAREARARARRQRGDRRRARAPRADARRAGDEPADVVARGDARERGDAARARRRARRPRRRRDRRGRARRGADGEPDEIVRAVGGLLAGRGPARGKRVLVSAGGTREPLDPVRFVGNRSSGRMGVALADEARVAARA